jgi:F0F1-type ATP synthase assembly protein I
MPEGPPDERREMGYYFALAQVGMEFVAPILLGVLLDRSVWNWAPWGLIGGAVLGFVGGLTHLIMLANQQNDKGSGKQGDKK